jgi:ribosomal protein S18 acetylase RimI-like enzyme
MATASVRVGGAEVARAHFDDVCALYDEVFSVPPFRWVPEEAEHHRQSLAGLMTNPTFTIAVAIDGGRLVGFAYGVALQVATGWWQGFDPPLEEPLTAEHEGRSFALIDLAVQERSRGTGLGRGLVDALLGARPEERATLCVQPTAEATREFYRHTGWFYVGRKTAIPPSVSPQWDVFVIDLQARPTAAR